MIVIPSIDLRGGQCVRLLKGAFDAETRYAATPLTLLNRYADAGAPWLHLVDLDGARDGTPANQALIRSLCAAKRMKVQLGGGLRSRDHVDAALQAGVSRVVLGSAAVEQPDLLQALLQDLSPDQLCLALDVRVDAQGMPRLRTRGWVKELPVSLWDFLEVLKDCPLRHVLCTDIDRDGALLGPNLELYAEARRRFPGLLWQASGGIRNPHDLVALADLGLAAAISGKALLEGHIRMEELQPFLPAA